ncbi:hypothetical protein LCGC14_1734870 [marine sediment metagenome]|uniref:Uncharacterized protein n=1 Tax=marine sediment metagenome TaxID=412755 RepID=A0A0F9H8F7_9ZZZZ
MSRGEIKVSPQKKDPVASVRDAATHYRNFGEGMGNEAFWFNEASALDAVADEVEALRRIAGKTQQLLDLCDSWSSAASEIDDVLDRDAPSVPLEIRNKEGVRRETLLRCVDHVRRIIAQ